VEQAAGIEPEPVATSLSSTPDAQDGQGQGHAQVTPTLDPAVTTARSSATAAPEGLFEISTGI
jgi:hypothetical protein